MLDTGVTAWMLTSASLVLLMTPGLAFFYGGMVRGKSVLNMMMLSFGAMAVVGVIYVLWGWSMSYGESVGGFFGNPFDQFGLDGAIYDGAGEFLIDGMGVPGIVGVAFQSTFAIITVALVSGALADRVKFGTWLVFAGVWATLSTPRAPLSFRFLGSFECRYQGEEVRLPGRLAETALALALHPAGITRDELNDFLVPDGHAPFTSGGMRSLVTRLRQVLPVSDAPYRFTVPYEADVVSLADMIRSGRIREAVSLMRGPLLPNSEAPGVTDRRWELEEQLRQAVLMAGDPDALYDLAERLGDDLEFWQAAAAALSAGDPRLALARARVRRLEESYGLS